MKISLGVWLKLGNLESLMFGDRRICIALFVLLIVGGLSVAEDFPPAVRQAACDSTVQLVCQTGTGSGVVVGYKDSFVYVLTANHVIAKSKTIELSTEANGKKISSTEYQLIWGFEHPDLALVRFAVGAAQIKTASISERLRNPVYPLPVLNTGWDTDTGAFTSWVDQALARKDVRHSNGTLAFFWQTKGKSIEGRSGGGLFSKTGELIGICSGNRGENGYFTHLDEIRYAIRTNASSSFLLSKDGK